MPIVLLVVAAAFVGLKVFGAKPKSASGLAQGSTLSRVGPASNAHASGTPGQANQPFVTQAVTVGAGMAATEIAKGLSSLFSASDSSNVDSPTIDEGDLTAAQNDMNTVETDATGETADLEGDPSQDGSDGSSDDSSSSDST